MFKIVTFFLRIIKFDRAGFIFWSGHTNAFVKTSTLICILKLRRNSKENFSAGQFRRHQFIGCSVNASWVSHFLDEYTLGWWWWHSAHSEWGPARWRKPHVGAIEGMSSNFYTLNHGTIKLDPIIALGKPQHWLSHWFQVPVGLFKSSVSFCYCPLTI